MSAEAGNCPSTEPIAAEIASPRSCSAAASVLNAPTKRSGSAMRQVARLSITMFFLSTVRYSERGGRENSTRLSRRTTRSNGAVTWRPGSVTTRTTRPNRVTSPYPVAAPGNNDDPTPQATPATITAGKDRRRSTSICDRPVRDMRVRLRWPLIVLGLFQGRPQEPHIDVLHVAGSRAHELPRAWQHVFERLYLQPELGQLRSAPV